MVPDYQKKRIGGNRKKFTQEEKKEAVIDLCVRTGAAKDIAKTYGISREMPYVFAISFAAPVLTHKSITASFCSVKSKVVCKFLSEFGLLVNLNTAA